MKGEMVKVTVLMPVYNGDKFLAESIQSILDQQYDSFELLVINDGSTDGTAEILDSFAKKDDRIKVVYQENAGIVCALNSGIAIAKGEYIARMDADDIAHPMRLAEQVKFLDENSDYIVCGALYEQFGAREGVVKLPIDDQECKQTLYFENCFGHPVVMFRKNVLESAQIEYESNYLYAEDYRLWTVLSKYGKFKNLPKVLLMYRVHEGQTSEKKRDLQKERHLNVAQEYLKSQGVVIRDDDIHKFLWPKIYGLRDLISYMLNGRLGISPLLYDNILHAKVKRRLNVIYIRNLIKGVVGRSH